MLQKLSCLRYLARRDQRLDLLRTLCHIKRESAANTEDQALAPAQAQSRSALQALEQMRFDPVYWQIYAEELSADARNNAETRYYIRKCIRYRPFDGAHYNLLGNLLWGDRSFELATEGYRIASCLAWADERYARSYFIASQHQKTQTDALTFVERRYQRHGKNSSLPARTLYWMLEALDRNNDAFKALEECHSAPAGGRRAAPVRRQRVRGLRSSHPRRRTAGRG